MSLQPFDERLKEHAEAIGYVSINWTWMEQIIDATLAYLASIPPFSVEAHCITVNADVSDKIKTLRALATHRQISDQWLDQVMALLKSIDEDLRPMRNRVIHDLWQINRKTGEVFKTYPRTIVKRPQSRQPMTLMTEEHTSMTAEEIRRIAQHTFEQTQQLIVLMRQVPGWTDAIS